MPDGGSARREHARLVRNAYESYGRDPRRRRAWAAANPGNVAIRSELGRALDELAAAELAGDGAVLDAGAGTGHWLARLARRGVAPERLHGLELIGDRVAAARRAAAGAAVTQGDVTAMPYPDERFRLALLFTVLSSLPTAGAQAAALREARRVLVPGGLLLVYEPRVPTPANRRTRRVRPRDVAAAVGPPDALRRLTVAPPLARRLGPRTDRLYPRLAAIPALRTHWLGAFRTPG